MCVPLPIPATFPLSKETTTDPLRIPTGSPTRRPSPHQRPVRNLPPPHHLRLHPLQILHAHPHRSHHQHPPLRRRPHPRQNDPTGLGRRLVLPVVPHGNHRAPAGSLPRSGGFEQRMRDGRRGGDGTRGYRRGYLREHPVAGEFLWNCRGESYAGEDSDRGDVEFGPGVGYARADVWVRGGRGKGVGCFDRGGKGWGCVEDAFSGCG